MDPTWQFTQRGFSLPGSPRGKPHGKLRQVDCPALPCFARKPPDPGTLRDVCVVGRRIGEQEDSSATGELGPAGSGALKTRTRTIGLKQTFVSLREAHLGPL